MTEKDQRMLLRTSLIAPEQLSYKPLENLVAVSRIERETRGL